MKLTAFARVAGVAAVTTLGLSPARAEIKLNENFSVSGYVVGSATYADLNGNDDFEVGDTSSSTMDMDAMKLSGTAKFAPGSGTLSLWSGADDKAVFLDAYFTYDMGGGTTVTAGKFLSWLGYEAFDPVNMSTYTYGWQSLPGALSIRGIPAYHTGVKIENSTDSGAFGVAVLDSNNYVTPVYKGDGNLKDGAGLEGYYTYKTQELTSFVGLSYDSTYDSSGIGRTTLGGADWWVQYSAGAVTYAGEICYTKFWQYGPDTTDVFGLLFAKFRSSDQLSLVGRVAYGETKTASFKPKYTKFTFSPIYTLTPNMEVLGEVSYATFDNASYDNGWFAALQGRFKF